MASSPARLVFSERARVGNLPVVSSDLPAPRPWLAWLGLAYGALGVLGVGGTLALGLDVFGGESWLAVSRVEGALASLALGLATAGLVITLSRMALRARWARALSDQQRPFAHAQSGTVLLAMALGSGLCEELFFRAFLGRAVGIVIAAVAFGALHQARGRGRWGWILSAAALGAWLSVVFALTGQLVGPIVAHVAINAANLRHLRDRVIGSPRKLGGLLAPATSRPRR